MRALRVAQADEDLLRWTADPYTLPAEAHEAEQVISDLFERIADIRQAHQFTKGTGLAAPQIGVPRRAAVIVDAELDEPIVLVNPVVTDMSAATDEPKFEGCLSFFDVRGRLARPLFLRVRHELLDGTAVVSTFAQGTARLVAHEIDHLDGILYADRMPPDEELISVAQYRGTGSRWEYDAVPSVRPGVPPAD